MYSGLHPTEPYLYDVIIVVAPTGQSARIRVEDTNRHDYMPQPFHPCQRTISIFPPYPNILNKEEGPQSEDPLRLLKQSTLIGPS